MTKIRIGRNDTNDFILKEGTVSRQHAELEDIGGGVWRLTDVGSSAGTYIKEGNKWTQVTSAEIRAGTMLRFGEAEAKLDDIVDAEPATVAPKAPPPTEPAPAAAKSPPASGLGARAAGASPAASTGSGMSPGMKIGMIAGGATLLLLVIIVIAVAALDGGGTSNTAGNTGQPATTGTPGGPTPGRPQPGQPQPGQPQPGQPQPGQPQPGQPPQQALSGARAQIHNRMLQQCRQRGQPEAGCRCMAREFTGAITEQDAQTLIRSAGNPPEAVKQRITRAAVQAGFKCASQLRPQQQN